MTTIDDIHDLMNIVESMIENSNGTITYRSLHISRDLYTNILASVDKQRRFTGPNAGSVGFKELQLRIGGNSLVLAIDVNQKNDFDFYLFDESKEHCYKYVDYAFYKELARHI